MKKEELEELDALKKTLTLEQMKLLGKELKNKQTEALVYISAEKEVPEFLQERIRELRKALFGKAVRWTPSTFKGVEIPADGFSTKYLLDKARDNHLVILELLDEKKIKLDVRVEKMVRAQCYEAALRFSEPFKELLIALK